MAAFALLLVSGGLAGTALARWLWRRDEARPGAQCPGGFEKLAAATLLGFAVVVGLSWALALVGALRPVPLAGGMILVAVAGLAGLRSLRRGSGSPTASPLPAELEWPSTSALALLLAPLAMWMGFALWRGYLLPPLNHDALAYHLTKAALIAREGAYRYFAAPDFRIPTFVSNYELLLADVLVLAGSDQVTEWISTLAFGFFIVASAGLSERWWGRGRHQLAVVLVAAGIPLALLHSAAHKNDLLVTAFVLCAILWTARWVTSRGSTALTLAVVSTALACGTKSHCLALAAAVGVALTARLVIDWRHGQRPRPKAVALFAVLCALAVPLLGGAPHAFNLVATGSPLGLVVAKPELRGGWGDWYHLWVVPYMILAAPFSARSDAVWNPWDGRYWLWPRYELFTSNYGWLVTLLVLLLPFVVWRYRHRWAAGGQGRERLVGSALGLATLLLILPFRDARPIGFFSGYTRYLLFIPSLVAAGTVAPFLRELEERRKRLAAFGLMIGLALVMAGNAFVYGSRDGFAPPGYLVWMMDHPGSREIAFRPIRAANIVDRHAGPKDHIAVAGGFESWSYPAFGADLGRRITFLPEQFSPSAIGDDVDWVIVDYAWTRIFGHPDFKNLGMTDQYIFRGPPHPEEMALLRGLAADRRFQLVWRDEHINQAIFARASTLPPTQGDAQ
jgi:hypothetical protein